MKFREPKDPGNDPIAVLDEFDVHNILCVGVQLLLTECLPDLDDDVTKSLLDDYGDGLSGCISKIVIEPEHPDKFNQGLVNKWDQLLTALFGQVRLLDGVLHEDAEYTC